MTINSLFDKRTLLSLLAAALLFGAPPAAAAEGGYKLYKWTDEHGVVRYGDQIPPQYARHRNETLNDQGIVVGTKAAAKTPEQLAEEARLKSIQEEEALLRREQAHQDRILLDTFTNENEMIMTRDGKIEAIEANIRVTKGRTEKTRQKLVDLNRYAAQLERSGNAVSEQLHKQISEARQQIRHNFEYIENRKQEQKVIREKFEHDINRFRELQSEATETAAAATP